ncbi:MAG: MFS transporter [Caldisphaera sp.]|nr:MFS transporter [Caldisphaera sp.]
MSARSRALIFTSIGHFLNDSFLVTFSILITYYLDMKISPLFLGTMGSLISILSGLTSIWVGREADKEGNHNRLMLAGFILIGLSSLLYASSFSYHEFTLTLIALASISLGMGLSFYHPLGGSILQHIYDIKESPRALGINGSFGSIGRAIFPVVLVFVIHALGAPLGLYLIGIYTFILSIIIYSGLKPINIQVEIKNNNKESNKVSLSSFYYVLIPLSIVVFLRAMFISGVQTYAPTYLEFLYKSKLLMSIILTVSYATAIFGQPYFGRLTSNIGGRSVVFITTIFSTLFYILFLFIKNETLSIIMFAVFSFFAFSGFPNLLGYVGQIVDKSVFAQANSLIWGVSNTIGGAIGIFLGGYILQIIGLENTMITFMILALISTALLPIIPKKRKK